MSKEFPFYPDLPEEAGIAAQKLMDEFKEEMKKTCDGILRDLYTDVAVYIEHDSWTNYRNQIMDGFRDYTGNRKIHMQYEFKAIRQQILKDHRAAIIEDLNSDMVEEIKSLKEHIAYMEEIRSRFG